jgi:hypothetical protein
MKQIVRLAACAVAFAFGLNANAQSESGNMSEEEMAKAILSDTTKVFVQTFQNPNTSIATEASVVAGQTVNVGDTVYHVGYKFFYKAGLRKAPAYIIGRAKTTVEVRDETQWEALKHASVETRFAEEMATSSGRKRDTQWYEATSGNDTLRIVKHANDKNHWYVAAQGDYQLSEGCNGFGGTLEVQYWSDSFWWAAAGGSITRNMMYELAEDAGANYTSYAGHAIGGLKFDLGRRENFTLALYGGLEATWQKTNSREFSDEFGNEYMMKSTHSNYAPVAGAMVRYRFPDSRVAIFARGEWSQKAYTYQNAENERHNAFKLSAGVSIGLHGNYVRTK